MNTQEKPNLTLTELQEVMGEMVQVVDTVNERINQGDTSLHSVLKQQARICKNMVEVCQHIENIYSLMGIGTNPQELQ